MNTRNRITLLLSVVMVLALLVVGMAITASAADGDVETEYGTVPAANANDCFAIFHKAEGAKEYTFLKSVADAFKDSVWEDYQSHTGHFAVVALNDSTITATDTLCFTNFVSMKADITFDLNGKTVNTNFNSSTKNSGLFWIKPVVVTEDTERNILVENGTITVTGDNIVIVANNSTLTGEKLEVNMTFRNDVMNVNLGSDWKELLSCEGDTGYPGEFIDKDIYVLYVGGNKTYYQLVILDEGWIM